MAEEHAADETDAKQIIALLETAKSNAETAELTNNDRELLRRFAANERQHLIVENAIVLPLARARLSETDKQNLGMRMAARRGTDLSKVPSD